MRATIVSSLVQVYADQLRAAGTSTRAADGASQSISLDLASTIYNATEPGVELTLAVTGNIAPLTAAEQARADALTTASVLLDHGDIATGRAAAQTLLASNPNDTDALALVAHSYLLEQDFDEAERLYRQAASIEPTNAGYQVALQDVETLRGSDDEVLAAAKQKLASPTTTEDGLRLLAHLTDRNGESAEAFAMMAAAFRERGKPQQAVGSLHEAVKYAEGTDLTTVTELAQQMVNDHPTVGLTHNILGRALSKAGDHDSAIMELKTATNIAPFNVGFITSLGDAYVQRAYARLEDGNYVGAEGDLNLAQSFDPGNKQLAEGRARVSAYRAEQDIDNGHHANALSRLSTAARGAPDDDAFKQDLANLYLRVATEYEKDGDTAIALSAYMKALEFDPDSTRARQHVSTLSHQRGLDALANQSYDTAIEHLQRAYDTYRPDATYGQDLAEAYNQRGQQRVALGDLDDAIDDFRAGISIDPTNTSLTANYSAAMWM